MNSRKQWLMTEQIFDRFVQNRTQMYPSSLNNINHHLLVRYYIDAMIAFLCRRRQAKQNPFNVEKIICTAVTLFKRYYLVNQFRENEEPAQHIICCMYLSLKLNQYSPDNIKHLASKWKKKTTPDVLFRNRYLHYYDEGYSDKQLMFLTNIGFQIGRSPLIQPLQSLYNQIQKNVGELQKDNWNKLIYKMANLLQAVYHDEKLIFLYPGPKLAIAITYGALTLWNIPEIQQKNIYEFLGEEVSKLFQQHKSQFIQLTDILLNYKKFHPSREQQDSLKRDRFLITKSRNNYETPPLKSPKMSPKSISSMQL